MPPKRKASPKPEGPDKRLVKYRVGGGIQHDPKQAVSPDLRAQIEESVKRSPRYLFRTWTVVSGGMEGLNTKDAITPLAFFHKEGPQSIFHLTRQQLTRLSTNHLSGGEDVSTVFSSWAQSLTTVLRMASRHPWMSYISIIDTKRLPERNVILYSPEIQRIIDTSIPQYNDEFLAFGVISGPAHSAVSITDLAATGLWSLAYPVQFGVMDPSFILRMKTPDDPRFRLVEKGDHAKALQVAREIGAMFGASFEVAMAAYLLTISFSQPRFDIDKSARLLADAEIPEEWSSDETITSPDMALISTTDRGTMDPTKRAISLLRAIVKVRDGEDNEKKNAQGTEAKTAKNQEGSKPRELKNLYIDMKWYER